MAPFLLPRVGKFPISGERSPLTVIGGQLVIPASERHTSPLIGKRAPEFELPDHLGRRCSLDAVISLGRPIILFFFPLAGSPHCTRESCMFRDALGLTPVFSEMQAIVIGISQDPPERSRRFVDEHKLGFRILHDVNRSAMNTYGVGRILMGLVDQRCTYIIDPSGTVRAMVEGVFDAVGHVRFAEKWLIRLEHELSQRSRQVMKYRSNAGDLIVGNDRNDDEEAVRVLYGDADSASIGGIDHAPRFGAAKDVSSKAPFTLKKPRERNRWRHWKAVFSQRIPQDRINQSFDDTASALELERRDPTKSAADDMSPQPRKRFGLPRSRSNARIKDLVREHGDEAQKISLEQMRRNSNRELPPLPPTAAQEYAMNNGGAHGHGSEGSDRETSGWTTESSMSSHASTAGTSLGTHGARSSALPSGLPALPAVTSEVLMASDLPVRRSASGSISGKHSLRQAALLNGQSGSFDRKDMASPLAPPRGASRLPASSSMPLSSEQVLTPQHFVDDLEAISTDQYLRTNAAYRPRQQTPEVSDLQRNSSLRRREGSLGAGTSLNGHESPAGRSDSPGSGQSHLSARDAIYRNQNKGAEDGGARTGIFVPAVLSNDKLQRTSSLRTGQLGRNRQASINDGIYRIGQLSLDSDAARLGVPSTDGGVLQDSQGEKILSALSPRARPPRATGNARATPTQHVRHFSGGMQASTDTTADGNSSTDTAVPKAHRKEVPTYSPNALLANLPVDVTDDNDDASPPLLRNISRSASSQMLESKTPRARTATLPEDSSRSRETVPSSGSDVAMNATVQTSARGDMTPSSSSSQQVHSAPFFPSTMSRASSLLSSPTVTDSSSSYRRASYAESVCSMGTFGRRQSSIYDSSATERGDDDDDDDHDF